MWLSCGRGYFILMPSVHGRFTLCARSYYVMRMAILCDLMSISIVREEKEIRRENFLESKFNGGRGIRTIGNLITYEIEPTNFPTRQTAAFGLVVRVMARYHVSNSEGREFESCFCN